MLAGAGTQLLPLAPSWAPLGLLAVVWSWPHVTACSIGCKLTCSPSFSSDGKNEQAFSANGHVAAAGAQQQMQPQDRAAQEQHAVGSN